MYDTLVDAGTVIDSLIILKSTYNSGVGGVLRNLVAVKYNISFTKTAFVDLGDLTWQQQDSSAGTMLFYAKIANTDENTTAALCDRYVNIVSLSALWYSNPVQMAFSMRAKELLGTFNNKNWANTIFVCDSRYSIASEFKQAVKGVLLAYKLAE
mgnify:CR=1 FL=1